MAANKTNADRWAKFLKALGESSGEEPEFKPALELHYYCQVNPAGEESLTSRTGTLAAKCALRHDGVG